jgi:hypothetical protein
MCVPQNWDSLPNCERSSMQDPRTSQTCRYSLYHSSISYAIHTGPVASRVRVLSWLNYLGKAWKVQPSRRLAGVSGRLLISSARLRLTYAGQLSSATELTGLKPSCHIRLTMLLHTFVFRQGIKFESCPESGHILCDNDPNNHHFPADHKPQHRLSFPYLFDPNPHHVLGGHRNSKEAIPSNRAHISSVTLVNGHDTVAALRVPAYRLTWLIKIRCWGKS